MHHLKCLLLFTGKHVFHIKLNYHQAVVVHASNPSTWEEDEANLSVFKASLLYGVISRTGYKATQRNFVSNKQTRKQTKNKPQSSINGKRCPDTSKGLYEIESWKVTGFIHTHIVWIVFYRTRRLILCGNF